MSDVPPRATLLALFLLLLRPGAAPGREGGSDPATLAVARPPAGDTLTLSEAVRVGLRQDPDIRAERAGRASASGERMATWGAFLPGLSANASFARSDFTTFTFAAPEGSSRRLDDPETGIRKSSSQGLSLSWTLLDGGRRLAAWKASGARVEAARHRVSAAERRTTAQVRLAYFDALEQRALVRVARQQLEARRRDLEITRRRYAIAGAGRSEILGARTDTLDARMRLLEARRQARSRTRALRAAMGAGPERVSAETPLARVGPLPEPRSLEAGRLARRAVRGGEPELEALADEARAASADRWAARSDYLPEVRVGWNLGRSEQLGREGDFFVLDPSNDQQSLSLSVSWSLFDGFARQGREAQASATLQRTRAQRSGRRIELETSVRDRVEELRRRWERLGLLRRKLELARERVEVTRERFRLGDVSYLDLQRVIGALNGAERERIAERFEYLRAWAELERWTGPLPGKAWSTP